MRLFFLVALDLGPLGQLSGVIAFAALGLIGQYAIYRARRYRLTRTIYRGVRFHQSGSAWRYAFCAVFWWSLNRAQPRPCLSIPGGEPRTLQDAQHLLRRSRQAVSPARACACCCADFPCGFWCSRRSPSPSAPFSRWWTGQALADALKQSGGDVMNRIESGNPALAGVIVFAMLMGGLAVLAAALLYPAFQALVLRWWSSGLRFGEIEMRSTLAHRSSLWRLYALPVVRGAVLYRACGDRLSRFAGGRPAHRQCADRHRVRNRWPPALLLVGYVVAALGFSTIYRATVMLSLWKLGMESLQMSGLVGARSGQGERRTFLAAGRGPGRRT